MVQDSFRILLDNPKKVYYPGQVLSGTFDIELDSPMKVRDITMKFKGKGHVIWSEGGGQSRRVYWSNETYFILEQVVYGKEHTQQDEFEIPSGQHSYPFSFAIPTKPELPPSFEFEKNYVRYTLKAIIDRPWTLKKKVKHVINLNSLMDLNKFYNEDLSKPGEIRGTKSLCCLCCTSRPIKANITTERMGYVPGDTVVFSAEINNNSGRRIKKSKCVLLMVVTLNALGRTKKLNFKLGKLFHGSIPSGGTDVYRNERLTIPPVPPSYLMGSRVLDIRYYIGIQRLWTFETSSVRILMNGTNNNVKSEDLVYIDNLKMTSGLFSTFECNMQCDPYKLSKDRAFEMVYKIVAVPAGPSINMRLNSEIVVGSIPLASVASQLGVTLPPAPTTVQGAPSSGYDETYLAGIPQASIEESKFAEYDKADKKKKEIKPIEETTDETTGAYLSLYTYYKWDHQDVFTTKYSAFELQSVAKY